VTRELILVDLRTRQYNNTDLIKLQKNEDDYLFKYIVNGQELTQSMDCRLISESQIKETRIIHVTIICLTNNNRQVSSSTSGSSSSSNDSENNRQKATTFNRVNKLTHDVVPMIILSNEPHFSNLFFILNKISNYKTTGDSCSITVQQLASKTWDIIILLPTNINLLNVFTRPENIPLFEDESSTYKLLYNLQIIEIIPKYCDDLNSTTIAIAVLNSTNFSENYKELLLVNNWKQKFIDMNGLKQLYGLFIKQMKYAFENNKWNEAFLDCLHIIMKLLVYYLIENRLTTSSSPISSSSS